MFTLFALLLLPSVLLAAPLPWKREVPQEHSHEAILRTVRESLNLNNPDDIRDPVFGLLGNLAADPGKGKINDTDCLQQAIADQAFTNAKAIGDVNGMVNALIFRALERNTGEVHLQSTLCTSIQAKNPEIAALKQHQDPASDGAAATNKAITLELAKQIKSVGGDPLDAIKSGTFSPGRIGDPTAKGNTCDDANDAQGCIFTLNLLVPDATEEEILAAVGGAKDGNGILGVDATATTEAAATTTSADADEIATKCAATITVTVTVPEAPAATATNVIETGTVTATATAATASSNDTNLQTSTSALGGISAPAVTKGGRGFQVANNSDFLNLNAALNRSCDVQKNKCADAANANRNAGFSVADCESQATACRTLIL